MSDVPARRHRGRRWLGMSLAGLALASLVGVFVGAGAATFNYAEGTSYLSNDPKACVNCHIMRDNFDGWRKASHHAAAVCNDCHVPHDTLGKYLVKMEHGYRHSKGFTFQDFREPIRMKDSSREVVIANCRRCHEELVSNIADSGARHGGGLDCLHCHADVGHGPGR